MSEVNSRTKGKHLANAAAYTAAILMSVVLTLKLSIESPVREGVAIFMLTAAAVSCGLLAFWNTRRRAHGPKPRQVPWGLSGSSFFAKDWDHDPSDPVL